MIRCAAPVPLILNHNGCKNRMDKQSRKPDHKQRNNDKIDDRNERENENTDNEDSEEDHDDINMECSV